MAVYFASSRHSLPAELVDEILGYVDPEDLSILCRCSRSWQRRAEPALYKKQQHRDEAMEWACENGNLHTIRKLVLDYGASPSCYSQPHDIWDSFVSDEESGPDPRPTWTLLAAAMHCQNKAMRTLYSLGARLQHGSGPRMPTHDGAIRQHANFIRSLVQTTYRRNSFQTATEDELRDRIEFYLDYLYPDSMTNEKFAREINSRLLQPSALILSGAENCIFEVLIDRGLLSVSKRYRNGDHDMTMLDMAITFHRERLIGMLVGRGANVHGTFEKLSSPSPPDGYAWLPRASAFQHIPILTAAQNSDYDSCLKSLVRNGADINMQVLMEASHHCYDPHWLPEQAYIVATPLVCYINSRAIQYVSTPSFTRGLRQLLELGAKVDLGIQVPPVFHGTALGNWLNVERGPYPGTSPVISTPTTIELLLDRCSFQALHDSHFRKSLCLLVQHGSGFGHVTRLLVKYSMAALEEGGHYISLIVHLIQILRHHVVFEHCVEQTARETPETVFWDYVYAMRRYGLLGSKTMMLIDTIWTEYKVDTDSRQGIISGDHFPNLDPVTGDREGENNASYADTSVDARLDAAAHAHTRSDGIDDDGHPGDDGRPGNNEGTEDTDDSQQKSLTSPAYDAKSFESFDNEPFRLRRIFHARPPFAMRGHVSERLRLQRMNFRRRHFFRPLLASRHRVGLAVARAKRVKPSETDPRPLESYETLLHCLCSEVNAESFHESGEFWGDWDSDSQLFTYLLMHGADPSLRWNGMTARDVLLWHLDSVPNLKAATHLKRLAGLMQSTRKLYLASGELRDHWEPLSFCYSDNITYNQVLALAEAARGGQPFAVARDSVEKLQSGDFSVLPLHETMYGFLPKPALQRRYAAFALYVVKGYMLQPEDRSLNKKFPEIKTTTVADVLALWKGKE